MKKRIADVSQKKEKPPVETILHLETVKRLWSDLKLLSTAL